MGTILKYIFYVALILVIYLVAKGIYDGKITEDTTVAQVGSNIADGTQQLVSDTKKAIDERADKAKAKEAAEKAAYLTPVPGGVGQMTIAMLLSNTLDAAERDGR